MEGKNIRIVLLSFAFFSALLFFFTPFVAKHLYKHDIDFVMLFIFQWVLSSIVWDQRLGFKMKTAILLWIALSLSLIGVMFFRDRVVFHFGHESWYHPVRFYVYIGLPTTLWWILVNWAISKQKAKKEIVNVKQ